MDGLVTAVAAAGGLLLGDPLEIVVERCGAHASLARPWWSCPSCGRPPGPAALVPLSGSLSRRNPCPTCGERRPHPGRPLVLALVCAAVFGAFAARVGADPVLPAYLVLGTALVSISAVDLERLIIPNRIVYPAGVAVVVLLVVGSAADGHWQSMLWALACGAGAFAAFFVVHVAVPRGMGFGDVRLAGLVGLATGWRSPGQAFVAFLAAFVLGSLVGVVVMAVSGQGRRTRVPFGPFLAAGAAVAVVAGGPLSRVILHHGT